MKNSLTELASQICFILLLTVCVVGDSISPEVTRYASHYQNQQRKNLRKFNDFLALKILSF